MIGFGKSFRVLIALVQENSNKVAIAFATYSKTAFNSRCTGLFLLGLYQ